MPYSQNFDLAGDHALGVAGVKREMVNIGKELVRHVMDYLKEEKINFQGDLQKSVDFEVKDFLKGLLLRVYAGAKHAVFIHEGTKPHWAPVRPIRVWARKKLGLTGAELKRATYLIRRKIAAEGTEAKPFFAIALKRLQGRISERIERAYMAGFNGQ